MESTDFKHTEWRLKEDDWTKVMRMIKKNNEKKTKSNLNSIT